MISPNSSLVNPPEVQVHYNVLLKIQSHTTNIKTAFTMSASESSGSSKNTAVKKSPTVKHTAAQHHGTITHLVIDLHRLELFYGKQQTSRRNEMTDIEHKEHVYN
jgi:hypothetical protein